MSKRIDRVLAPSVVEIAAPLCRDHEFLRRATLDLTGTIPTADEARAFLAANAPDKRQQLVDRLLANSRYPLHMAEVFSVMLMERRPDKHIPTAEWQTWLQTAFRENRPWTSLAKDLLSADGTDPASRPATKFLMDRDVEPNLVTRDIGRIFFGVDLQCAQCHDHPLVDDYRQSDYYALFAFVNRTTLFTDPGDKKVYLQEQSEGNADFKSVFTGDAGRSRPGLFLEPEIDEPFLRLGEDYVTPPAANARAVPKHSRRQQLGELVAKGTNRAFAANIANRLWAQLLGRGLVTPVDWHHPDNPPSHPEVLDLLVQELQTTGYDLKHLIRQIVLTEAYQRSIEMPSNLPDGPSLVTKLTDIEAALTTADASVQEAQAKLDAARELLSTAKAAASASVTALDTAKAAVVTAKKTHNDAVNALNATKTQLEQKRQAFTAINEIATKATEALKLLPGDQEAVGAAAVFTARAAKTTEEIAALEKSQVDQQTAADAAGMALATAHQAAEGAYAAWQEAHKPVFAAKNQILEARRAWGQQEAVLVLLKREQTRMQATLAYQTSLTELAKARSQVGGAEAQLTTAQAQFQAQQAAMAELTNAVTATTQAMNNAAQSLQEGQAVLAQRQQVATLISEAATKTEAALQQLSGDEPLATALTTLQARQGTLAAAVAEAQKLVTERAVAHQAALANHEAAQKGVLDGQKELTAREEQRKQAEQGVELARQAVVTQEANRAAASEKWVDQLAKVSAVRDFKALSPEQMTWAIFQSTGVTANYLAAAEGEIEKTIPKASVESDPAKQLERQTKVIEHAYNQLKGNIASFSGLYGGAAGQPQDDFFATADQALFLANGGALKSWLSPAGQNLTQRLVNLAEAQQVAEELYLSVYARLPEEPEVLEVVNYLQQRPEEKAAAVQELGWALMTSAEFRFQQ